MSITAQNIINKALASIGAVPAGDTPSSTETADALADLNGLLDSLNADRNYLYTLETDTYNLVAGTASYAIGPGQTWNGTLPLSIDDANLIDLSNPAQPVRMPLRVVDADGWASIRVRNVATPLPSVLYFDGGFPTGTVWLWGIPSAANQVELFIPKLLTALATAATSLIVPPGYYEYLWSHLAMRVAPDYGRDLPALVQAVAEKAAMRLESVNAVTPTLAADSALMGMGGRGRGTFNWITNNR